MWYLNMTKIITKEATEEVEAVEPLDTVATLQSTSTRMAPAITTKKNVIIGAQDTKKKQLLRTRWVEAFIIAIKFQNDMVG
mmetsp:Transcript_52438/g.77610  ORF Transcript_52438/g.77610 Transcript_52438/m.77610 type:complete len:81 (-) Transcript_52438:4-246(-)